MAGSPIWWQCRTGNIKNKSTGTKIPSLWRFSLETAMGCHADLSVCAHFLWERAIKEPKRDVTKQLTLVYMLVIAQSVPFWEGISELPDSLLSGSCPFLMPKECLGLSCAHGEISNSSSEKEKKDKSLSGFLKLECHTSQHWSVCLVMFGRCRERYIGIWLLYMVLYSSLPRKWKLVLSELLLMRNFSWCPIELNCYLTGKDTVMFKALYFGFLLCVVISIILCSVWSWLCGVGPTSNWCKIV